MTRLLVRRLGSAFFVLVTVTTLVFVTLYGIGDACVAKLGANADPDRVAECRQKYGFDRPLREQYLSYVGLGSCVRKSTASGPTRCGLLQGDLGVSVIHAEDVTRVVMTRLPRTLLLGTLTLLFEVSLGLLFGILAALRQHRWVDTAIMSVAYTGISAPTFLTGLVFLYLFAFRLGWFPVGGFGVHAWDHVYHALLPAFTLASFGAATYARIVRSEVVEVLKVDYVRTAHAKGASPVRVILRHAVRNALLPVVTLVGLQVRILVSGAIITESVFAWPGVGRLALESIVNQDAFMVMGVVLIASTAVQLGNLSADLAVAALDPRIRHN